MNPKRTRCLARIVWARLRLLLLMLMVTHEAYETSNFMPPHPLSLPHTRPTPACQATRCLLLEWEKCDTRVTCTSSSWSFSLDITLASPNLTLCLTYSHCLPLAHSLSLSSCTLTGGISISRGTTMKTNAFRTKRAQIWNNFLLVNQTKGHVPPSSTRCTPLYTLPPLPL